MKTHQLPTMTNLLYTLSRFGPEFLYDIADSLNEGHSQKEIAVDWKTDQATISRIINRFLIPHYRLNETSVELVDAYSQIVMRKHDRIRSEARVFQLGADRRETQT